MRSTSDNEVKMMNKTPIYINADRLIDWIDAGHCRSPTEPVFSEQEIVHIIKQQPVCLVEPIVYAEWKEIRGMAPPEDHGKHKCSNCGQLALSKKMHEYLSDRCPHCGAHMEWESQYD